MSFLTAKKGYYVGVNTMVTFRHSAGFGRRMEYWIIGLMLKEGLYVYVPLVDDFGIDAVIRKNDNTFIEVQIKARSKNVRGWPR